ncbi:hypothetical protein DENSPDRAFT_432649 [Dentipellis sp. KUC8613]|nr:hypothetical protein DENSPDRAFT_432649 [Dentipellis sp. KUC8613]
MKSSTLFATVLSLLLYVFVAAAAPPPAQLPSFLSNRGTFYRAVTGQELRILQNVYRVGSSPASHATLAGDFSATGALYVFNDLNEAHKWGKSFTLPQDKQYVIVQFSYTPNTRLRKQSFPGGSQTWANFVNNNYLPQTRTATPRFDMVEGPISVGRGNTLQPFLDPVTGQQLWQGAFLSRDALNTLVVTNIQAFQVGQRTSFCPNCNIQ